MMQEHSTTSDISVHDIWPIGNFTWMHPEAGRIFMRSSVIVRPNTRTGGGEIRKNTQCVGTLEYLDRT